MGEAAAAVLLEARQTLCPGDIFIDRTTLGSDAVSITAADPTANEPGDERGNVKKWPPILRTRKISIGPRNNGRNTTLTTGRSTAEIVRSHHPPHLSRNV